MVNLEKNRVCRWRTWSISPRRARNERRIFDAAV